jgi:hypothetical protein
LALFSQQRCGRGADAAAAAGDEDDTLSGHGYCLFFGVNKPRVTVFGRRRRRVAALPRRYRRRGNGGGSDSPAPSSAAIRRRPGVKRDKAGQVDHDPPEKPSSVQFSLGWYDS